MKSLQRFRKDELVLQEESDGCPDDCDGNDNKENNSVEEAYNLVESIDKRMNRIT